jgi:hypothetical protein
MSNTSSPWYKKPEKPCQFAGGCSELAEVAISKLQAGNSKMRMTIIFSVDETPQNHLELCIGHAKMTVNGILGTLEKNSDENKTSTF